jgi:predicted nucleotidyltransferase
MRILMEDLFVIYVAKGLIKGVRDVSKYGIVLKSVRLIIGKHIKINAKKSRKHNYYYNSNSNHSNSNNQMLI